MNFYVYLLISINTVKPISYVGYTSNLSKRLELHNNGKGAKFTKGRKWKLIFSKKYNSKNKAMTEEYKLKNNKFLRKNIKEKYQNK